MRHSVRHTDTERRVVVLNEFAHPRNRRCEPTSKHRIFTIQPPRA